MKKIMIFFFALLFCGAAYSQSADVITDMLSESEVTFGQVCYLSAVHQQLINENSSFDDAIQVLYEKGQIPQKNDKNSAVVMANIAFIYSQMWNIKGGLMYKITNGSPRYAFKQMKADGIIEQNIDPAAIVSGVEALNLYTSCCIQYGGMVLDTNE